MAVMALVEDIATAIDNREYTMGVFIVLTNAFDAIDHTLLLRKLQKYGVRGMAYASLQSYLWKVILAIKTSMYI